MGLAHSPRIVTDGLVLALDAGNVKGYDSKENRILYSEDLTQWTNTSSVDTSNTQIAPNGTQTADEVYATSTTVNQGLIYRSSNTGSTFVQNSWHTFSVHWKAGTSSGVRIQLPWNDGGNAGVFATFVESGGEVSVPTVGGYGNYESGGATVEKLNNGWYRFSITFRPTGVPTGSYFVWLYPSITSGGARTTNTTSYIWGAQTEVGQSVTTYVKTESSNKIRGTTWTDLSGKGNNGTLQNGPTYDNNNLGSFSLDGGDDRVLISCNNSTIRTFNSTTQFIVKLPVYSGGQRCILSYRTGAGLLYIGKSNNGIFCYYNQLSPSPAFTVGNITANSTIICAVTCDATNNLLSTYINGTLAGSASRTGWISTYHTSLYLGWDAGGTNEYMLGNFYQFSHYNRVLTASEISQNFNALRGRFGI